MGKFSDALDKSRSEKKPPTHDTLSQQHLKTQADAVEAIRLDTSAQVTVAEESFLLNGDVDPRLISFVAPQSPAAEEFKLMRARIFCKISFIITFIGWESISSKIDVGIRSFEHMCLIVISIWIISCLKRLTCKIMTS